MKKHYKLKDICKIGGGLSKYNLKYANKNPGIYPVYGNSKTKTPKCYINSFDYQGSYIYFINRTDRKFTGKFFYLQNKKFCISNTANILLIFKNFLNLKYLFFFLTKINIKNYLISSTSSICQLRNDEAYDIDVFLPSLNIQNYFVKRLWFLKESFEKLKKLKIQLKDIKRKLLRYCFGKYLNDEKDLHCKLKKICVVKFGNKKLNKKYCDKNKGPYPVYSSKTTGDRVFAWINTFDYNGTYIWFTNRGSCLANFYYEINKNFSIYESAAIIYLKNKTKILNLKYLYFYLLFEQENIKHLLSVGAAMKHINYEDISNYFVQIPYLSIQSKIIKFLSLYDLIDPVILKIDNFLNSYNSYKKTLLKIIFSLIK